MINLPKENNLPRKQGSMSIAHPGSHIRENFVNPRNLTVTKVAKLIGVSRPSVSNFLNGKVPATPDMAARLERAFGVSAKTVLDLQAVYDAQNGKAADIAQKARTSNAPTLEQSGQRPYKLVHNRNSRTHRALDAAANARSLYRARSSEGGLPG